MDFSGCIDIVRGTARIFGFRLEDNFHAPYFSKTIKEFWLKWHMTLSQWLRDYVYIPLGGNRKGRRRKYVNLMVTFLISGLWHGVGATFILWGVFHAVCQIMEECLDPFMKRVSRLLCINTKAESWRAIQVAKNFLIVNFGWIIFRSNGLKQAVHSIWTILFHQNVYTYFDGSLFDFGLNGIDFFILFIGTASVGIYDFCRYKKNICVKDIFNRQNALVKACILYLIIFSIIIFGTYGEGYDAQKFIYGQF